MNEETDLLDSNNEVAEITPEADTRIVLYTSVGSYEKGTHLMVPANQLRDFFDKLKKVITIMPKKEGTAKELICKMIKARKSDAQILAEVENTIPESAADRKHCTKYRRILFSTGEIDVDLAAVGSVDHKDWAKSHMVLAKKGPHKEHWIEVDKAEKVAVAAAKKKAADAKKAATAKTKADKAKALKKAA